MSKQVSVIAVLLFAATSVSVAKADECFDYFAGDSCADAYGGWGPGGTTLCNGCTQEGQTWYCDSQFEWDYVIEPFTDPEWHEAKQIGDSAESGYSGILETKWIDCIILSYCADFCHFDAEWDEYFCEGGLSSTYLDIQEDILGPFECPLPF